MSTTLKSRLRTSAAADAGLQALLGTAPFRMYDVQLVQGSAFPAVTYQLISNPRVYALTGRMPTSWVRMQFNIYGSGTDSSNADAVQRALQTFLSTWASGDGVAGRSACPNFIVGDRDFGVAQTQPLTFMRIVDVMIFNNDSL
jgi:hypothetical protein